jgi:polysaccharide pyruvyl transferase WcaK-like protein
MRRITLLDTSVATDNLGDEIIMDAVAEVARAVLPDGYFYRVATHERMGATSRGLIRSSDLSIVGGTNILSSSMLSKNALWKLGLKDILSLKSVVLLGVGWHAYMSAPKSNTQFILKKILSGEYIHSVRDSYTADKLANIGKSVVNTSCITMWRLTPEHCAALPRNKANKVVTTLTFYKKDREADRGLLSLLKEEYEEVAFWPQQSHDLAYFQSLGISGIEIIQPQLASYNSVLDSEDVDFIGTRLHGGIRAMQKGHRALIMSVDNRATEISRDTNLPVLNRSDLQGARLWIHGGTATEIRLPLQAIETWKLQFAGG